MATVGVDVGGTKILAVVADRLRPDRLGPQERRPTPRGAEAVASAITDAVAAVRAATVEPVTGVGVGVPGLVDRTGRLRMGPNLPHVLEYPFADVLHERLGVPVTVDNDATCAAWAEREWGAARGAADALLVTLGTGIGAGIIAGGQLQRGANGFAGEPGHMVVDPNGPHCPCGRRGCWERFASGSGLGRIAREAAHAGRARRVVELAGGDPEGVRGEHVSAAASEDDPEALAVFRDYAWWVALGIANLVNVLDPSVVVVGGGLAMAGDVLLGPVRDAYQDLVLAADHRPPVDIVRAELGDRAGAIGAALLAADRA